MVDRYTETQLNEDRLKVSRMQISDEKKQSKIKHLVWLRSRQPNGDKERYRKAILEA